MDGPYRTPDNEFGWISVIYAYLERLIKKQVHSRGDKHKRETEKTK